MPDVFLSGGELPAPIEFATNQFPRFADAAKLVDAGSWSEGALTQLNVTKISLHTADPGLTGANEISGSRNAITTLIDTDLFTDGEQDGDPLASPATATHYGLWTTTA